MYLFRRRVVIFMKKIILKKKSGHGKRVIPGFGISMGVTMTMMSLIILIPMASIIISTVGLSFHEFIEIVTARDVVSGYKVSLSCALIAALINCVFGVILAWVLVRYEFPGKRILDGLIELPFALPTAVGRANGSSTSPSKILLPGNSYRTNTHANITPNTQLISAAIKAQDKLTLYPDTTSLAVTISIKS